MSDTSSSSSGRSPRERDWYSGPEKSARTSRRAYSFYNPLKSGKRFYGHDSVEGTPPFRGKNKYYDSASGSDPDSDIDVDDEPRARAYRFRLDRASPAPTTPTENESEDELLVADRSAEAGGGRLRSVLGVVESRYTGMGILGRRHGARVTVVQGSEAGAPLFRWIHFPWKDMSLEHFADEVSRTPGLAQSDYHVLADVMDTVRRESLHISGPRRARTLGTASGRRPLPSDGAPRGRSSTQRFVQWFAVPYFSLEPYSRSDPGSEAPVYTLLQAQFSRAGKARDMQQAVCKNGDAPPGHCFHIAHLWCLVLDNSVLFTCYRLPETNLFGQSIERTLRPSGKPRMKISVFYRGCVMWSIPVDESETWIRFISHFRQIWPRRFLFFKRNREVTPSDWPKIWRTACRAGVTLDLKIGKALAPPQRGLLVKPQEDEVAPSAKLVEQPSNTPPKPATKSPAPSSTNFSILTCLPGVSATDPYDRLTLERQLEKVHQYLLRRTPYSDRKMYRAFPEDTRAAVYRYLEAGGQLEEPAVPSDSSQEDGSGKVPLKNIDDKIDLFNAANTIFNFFFPAPAEGLPMAGKYWGSISQILNSTLKQVDMSYGRTIGHTPVHAIRSMLRPLATKLDIFTDIFKHEDRSRITVPDELMEAWIHLLMGLIYSPMDRDGWDELVEGATELVDLALADMMMAMSGYTLRSQAVILPMELACLMSLELITGAPPGLPSITKTYLTRLATIENDVTNTPSDRSHERNINLLQQEVSIVQQTLASQSKLFSTLSGEARDTAAGPWGRFHLRADRDDEWEDVKIKSTRLRSRPARGADGCNDSGGKLNLTGVGAGGFRRLLLDEGVMQLEGMEAEFDQIRHQAQLLSEFNQNKVDTTKDRQERAIYVFTIVTIIFLPLSAVSSMFGMNTSDIRDMEFSQWAYWAAALPVTAAVIFLGLLFTGELRNLLRWAVEGAKRKDVVILEGTEGERLLGRGEMEYVPRHRRQDNPRVHWS